MRPIAQDISDFRELREKGCIYVDKTDILHALIRDPGRKLYFISRPRRFGKSLMLSTLKSIFQGRRDLFAGLAIDKLDYDWADYPILQFSFAGVKATSLEAFVAEFRIRVKKVLTEAQCAWDDAVSPGANFNQAITDLAKMRGKPVAILIDEYDAPVGHTLADIPLATAIRGELSDFYIQIKECASDVRFLMMTGVTRFTQLSVFSALNNLNDLTMDARYATLLGYTEEELDANFDEHLRAHAQVMGLAYDDYRAQLRWWYNGYRFAPDTETKVYNPVSIAKTLGQKRPHTTTSAASPRAPWTSAASRRSSPSPCSIKAATSPSRISGTRTSPSASPMRRSASTSTPSSSNTPPKTPATTTAMPPASP